MSMPAIRTALRDAEPADVAELAERRRRVSSPISRRPIRARQPSLAAGQLAQLALERGDLGLDRRSS